MQHYWAAKAICDRIGYRCSARLPDLIIRYHLPAFRRRHPEKHHITVYYSNSEMLSKWEIARAQQSREALIAKQQAKEQAAAEKSRYGPRGLKNTPSHDPRA